MWGCGGTRTNVMWREEGPPVGALKGALSSQQKKVRALGFLPPRCACLLPLGSASSAVSFFSLLSTTFGIKKWEAYAGLHT